MKCFTAPYEGDRDYIFFSYCHKDAARVYPIIERMAMDGFRVWYDSGIRPGDDWPEVIAVHLERASAVVAAFSEASVESHNCRNEVTYAVANNKSLISVVLEDVQMPKGMRMQLGSSQVIRPYEAGDTEQFYAELLAFPVLEKCRDANRRAGPADMELWQRHVQEYRKAGDVPADNVNIDNGFLEWLHEERDRGEERSRHEQAERMQSEEESVTPPEGDITVSKRSRPREAMKPLPDDDGTVRERREAEEAERKRLEADEAERKRLAAAAELKRLEAEAERKRREAEEAERKRREAAEERKRREEEERKRLEEEERKRREEEERKRREEEERRRREEEERRRREEEERKRREEEERKRREEEERKRREEEERKRREDEERKRLEEEERKRREEEERRRLEEEERKRREAEAAERRRLEEEERRKREAEEAERRRQIGIERQKMVEREAEAKRRASLDMAGEEAAADPGGATIKDTDPGADTVIDEEPGVSTIRPDLLIPAVLYRKLTGEVFPLEKKQVVLGRGKDRADVVLEGNREISRRHAEVIQQDQKLYLKDLCSTFGTEVNGSPADSEEPVELGSVAAVSMGSEEFLILSGPWVRDAVKLDRFGLLKSVRTGEVRPVTGERFALDRSHVWDGEVLTSRLISRRSQTEIECRDGEFLLRDLDSPNGTFLNGEKLTDRAERLCDGDEISVVEEKFVFLEIAIRKRGYSYE